MITYKMSLLKSLKLLAEMIFIVIGFLMISIFILPINNAFIIAVLIVFAAPTIFLHALYTSNDWGKSILIEDEKMYLEFEGEKTLLNNANKIVINCTSCLIRKTSRCLISKEYYNITFYFEQGKGVTASSLIDTKLIDYVIERFNEELIEYEYYFHLN